MWQRTLLKEVLLVINVD